MNGTDPILVVFSDKSEKDQLWTKLSMKIVDDIVKRRSSIFITHVSKRPSEVSTFLFCFQDCSDKRRSLIEARAGQSNRAKRTAVVKPLASTRTTSKKPPVPAEEEKVPEVRFKSPTRQFNKKNNIKRELLIY